MGVKQLNLYLKKYCNKSIKKINLYELKNKKIAVDTSIYIYKYLTTETLLESIFNMCFRFRQYNINAVFVFDGKPPKEKEEELKKRSIDKKNAEKKFNELERIYMDIEEQQLKYTDMDEKQKMEDEKQKLQNQMSDVKKSFVRINEEIINNVKLLIMSCGLSYIESPCEADVLCAHLIHSNKVYAVMSEDMDMFVYGCARVLRYFSIIHNTCILYSYNDILNELDINSKNFKQICIYSGTDYSRNSTSFYENMNIYRKNKNIIKQTSYFNYIFEQNQNYTKNTTTRKIIENSTIEELESIYDMFDINNYNFDLITNIKIKNSVFNPESIKKLLVNENFIFV